MKSVNALLMNEKAILVLKELSISIKAISSDFLEKLTSVKTVILPCTITTEKDIKQIGTISVEAVSIKENVLLCRCSTESSGKKSEYTLVLLLEAQSRKITNFSDIFIFKTYLFDMSLEKLKHIIDEIDI